MKKPTNNLIDCHSHVLPEMDDGAKNKERTKIMLENTFNQGIEYLVATPHFYPKDESIESFKKRRDEAIGKMLDAVKDSNVPKISYGAEVAFYTGISASDDIEELCYKGSNIMLIEMPFDHWNKTDVEEVLTLASSRGIVPILAHIERFIPYDNMKYLKYLHKNGCILQSNGEFFTMKETRRDALKLLKKGFIQLLGSDQHGVTHRFQNLEEATNIIIDELGEERLYQIYQNSKDIIHSIEYIN